MYLNALPMSLAGENQPADGRPEDSDWTGSLSILLHSL